MEPNGNGGPPNTGGMFRSFGCPFSNGNGQSASPTTPKSTNGDAVNGNGTSTTTDNYHIHLHANASREIPKGGMLYGDYLQVCYFNNFSFSS